MRRMSFRGSGRSVLSSEVAVVDQHASAASAATAVASLGSGTRVPPNPEPLHRRQQMDSDVLLTGYLKKLKTGKRKFFVLHAGNVGAGAPVESTGSSSTESDYVSTEPRASIAAAYGGTEPLLPPTSAAKSRGASAVAGGGGPARLDYFDSEKKWRAGLLPKRSIVLRSCFNINGKHDPKGRCVVALYTARDCLALVCASADERDNWLTALLRLQHGAAHLPADHRPSPYFDHIWEVTIKAKSLGLQKNLQGEHRLCLAARTLSLVRLGAESDAGDGSSGCERLTTSGGTTLEFALNSIRRCGHTDCFFFMELGRSSVTGAGELWMQTDDTVIAQNMHEVILSAMKSSKSNEASSRTRTGSTSDNSHQGGGSQKGVKPISLAAVSVLPAASLSPLAVSVVNCCSSVPVLAKAFEASPPAAAHNATPTSCPLSNGALPADVGHLVLPNTPRQRCGSLPVTSRPSLFASAEAGLVGGGFVSSGDSAARRGLTGTLMCSSRPWSAGPAACSNSSGAPFLGGDPQSQLTVHHYLQPPGPYHLQQHQHHLHRASGSSGGGGHSSLESCAEEDQLHADLIISKNSSPLSSRSQLPPGAGAQAGGTSSAVPRRQHLQLNVTGPFSDSNGRRYSNGGNEGFMHTTKRSCGVADLGLQPEATASNAFPASASEESSDYLAMSSPAAGEIVSLAAEASPALADCPPSSPSSHNTGNSTLQLGSPLAVCGPGIPSNCTVGNQSPFSGVASATKLVSCCRSVVSGSDYLKMSPSVHDATPGCANERAANNAQITCLNSTTQEPPLHHGCAGHHSNAVLASVSPNAQSEVAFSAGAACVSNACGVADDSSYMSMSPVGSSSVSSCSNLANAVGGLPSGYVTMEASYKVKIDPCMPSFKPKTTDCQRFSESSPMSPPPPPGYMEMAPLSSSLPKSVGGLSGSWGSSLHSLRESSPTFGIATGEAFRLDKVKSFIADSADDEYRLARKGRSFSCGKRPPEPPAVGERAAGTIGNSTSASGSVGGAYVASNSTLSGCRLPERVRAYSVGSQHATSYTAVLGVSVKKRQPKHSAGDGSSSSTFSERGRSNSCSNSNGPNKKSSSTSTLGGGSRHSEEFMEINYDEEWHRATVSAAAAAAAVGASSLSVGASLSPLSSLAEALPSCGAGLEGTSGSSTLSVLHGNNQSCNSKEADSMKLFPVQESEYQTASSLSTSSDFANNVRQTKLICGKRSEYMDLSEASTQPQSGFTFQRSPNIDSDCDEYVSLEIGRPWQSRGQNSSSAPESKVIKPEQRHQLSLTRASTLFDSDGVSSKQLSDASECSLVAAPFCESFSKTLTDSNAADSLMTTQHGYENLAFGANGATVDTLSSQRQPGFTVSSADGPYQATPTQNNARSPASEAKNYESLLPSIPLTLHVVNSTGTIGNSNLTDAGSSELNYASLDLPPPVLLNDASLSPPVGATVQDEGISGSNLATPTTSSVAVTLPDSSAKGVSYSEVDFRKSKDLRGSLIQDKERVQFK